MAQKIKLVIAGLGGRGCDVYGRYAIEHPLQAEVVGVAEPGADRRLRACREWGVPPERCFETAEALFSQPRMADAAVIATQDRQHFTHASAALEKGYHVLLEKPVAVSVEECEKLCTLARQKKRHVVVCHVLRYSPFYLTLKRLLKEEKIGRVVCIQATEQIGYWHYAHSFVRGSWRRVEDSCPMILAKCCHDLDILLWLSGETPLSVSSIGGNRSFCADNRPLGAADRCLDCTMRRNCPYDAVRFYLEDKNTGIAGGHTGWPVNVLAVTPTEESIRRALREGPYGRCVYACDNDAADHQTVAIRMTHGVTIDFTVSAFTERCARTIKVMGTHGCIEGDTEEGFLRWTDFTGGRQTMQIGEGEDGHGGGDGALMEEFLAVLAGQRAAHPSSGLEEAVKSHIVALLAERSRRQNGTAVPVTEAGCGWDLPR